MDLEIVSKEAIRPSKPTTPYCNLHKLSILDQLSPSIYVPVLLFYKAPSKPRENLSKHLKSALLKTLTYYHPFAGKIKDGANVECDEEGALFLEARIKNNLADILTSPDLKALNAFFPNELQWKSSKNSRTLAVQLSHFDCGGFSIGICISHKIGDASTIFAFLNDWSALARESGEPIYPLFNSSTVFPPTDQFVIPEVELVEANVVTRRYVFHKAKISELKATMFPNSEAPHNPTRVEVVTSLIYKSIIQANKSLSLGSTKAYVLAQTVNLRPRMVPPLPRNSMGNIAWYFPVMTKANDDVSLEGLVTKMKGGLEKLCDFVGSVQGEGWSSMVAEWSKDARDNIHNVGDAYKCSSWCQCPAYQVDFGWGSPIWVSTAGYPYRNNILLVDSKDGEGIEAWVTLDEEIMGIFQDDEGILKFAYLNPSI